MIIYAVNKFYSPEPYEMWQPKYLGPIVITGITAICLGLSSFNNVLIIAVVGVVLVQLQNYIAGGQYTGNTQIPGKTVLITGANCGIGKETAKELARRGGRIIMACRDMVKAEDARTEIIKATGNPNIICKKLDLASLESVRTFAKDFNKSEKRLDILINNAGIMMCPKTQTEDGIELQLGVNHMGHFLLTNLLLDKLKASAPSRILITSSLCHNWEKIHFDDLNFDQNYDSLMAYSASKLANMLHVLELSKRLKGTGVTVNGLHPGLVNSHLLRHVSGVNSPILRFLAYPVSSILLKSPVQGIQTTLRLALDPDLENVSGKYFCDCEEKPPNPRALDNEAAERMWKVSGKLTAEKKK